MLSSMMDWIGEALFDFLSSIGPNRLPSSRRKREEAKLAQRAAEKPQPPFLPSMAGRGK
jgi:hypothetical protein